MKHSNTITLKYTGETGVQHTFQLRNLEVYERMSEETTAFVADLYIGDFFIGTCENSGKGEGNYPRYAHMDDKNEWEVLNALVNGLLTEVEKHHFHMDNYYGRTLDWQYDLDFLISEMVGQAWECGRKTYKFADEK